MDLSEYKLTSIEKELIPLYDASPERFRRFHNAVYLLLDSIPEGGSIRVIEHCNPTSYSLFIKLACFCIREEMIHKEVTDAILGFSDDYSEVHRSYKFIPATIWHHFYSRRKGVDYSNLLPCKGTNKTSNMQHNYDKKRE